MRPDIKLIEDVSAMLVQMLGEEFDHDTFWDTLDGETDAGEIMDHLLKSMHADQTLADAIKAEAYALSKRQKRIAERASAKKKTLGLILDATGQKKAERPRATVSRVSGRLSVQITDADQVPTQLCKVVSSPDKAAIKKQIDAGEHVPGAELVRGEDTISVRVA